jgi:hypothetical protein
MPGWLISPVGPHQRRAIAGDQLLEVPTGKALVAQEEQSRSAAARARGQHGSHDFTFAQLGGGQAPGDGEAVGGGQHIQPEAPEEAMLALAVAIAGMAGQRRPVDGLPSGRTRHRGRVDQAQLVAEDWGVRGQVLDGKGDQGRPGAAAGCRPRRSAGTGTGAPAGGRRSAASAARC